MFGRTTMAIYNNFSDVKDNAEFLDFIQKEFGIDDVRKIPTIEQNALLMSFRMHTNDGEELLDLVGKLEANKSKDSVREDISQKLFGDAYGNIAAEKSTYVAYLQNEEAFKNLTGEDVVKALNEARKFQTEMLEMINYNLNLLYKDFLEMAGTNYIGESGDKERRQEMESFVAKKDAFIKLHPELEDEINTQLETFVKIDGNQTEWNGEPYRITDEFKKHYMATLSGNVKQNPQINEEQGNAGSKPVEQDKVDEEVAATTPTFKNKEDLYKAFNDLVASSETNITLQEPEKIRPAIREFFKLKDAYFKAHPEEQKDVDAYIDSALEHKEADDQYTISEYFRIAYRREGMDYTDILMGNTPLPREFDPVRMTFDNVNDGKPQPAPQSDSKPQQDPKPAPQTNEDKGQKPLTIGAIPGGDKEKDKAKDKENDNVNPTPQTQTQPKPEKEKVDEYEIVTEEYLKLSLNGDENDARMDLLRVGILQEMKKIENVDIDNLSEQEAIEILHNTLPKLSDKEFKEMESRVTDKILTADPQTKQAKLLGLVPQLVLAEKYEELRGIVNKTKSGPEHDAALDKFNKIADRIDSLASQLLTKKTNRDLWFNDYTNIADIHYGYEKMFAVRERDLIELAKEGNQDADQRVGIMRDGMALLNEEVAKYDKRMNLSDVNKDNANDVDKRFDAVKPRIDGVELNPETLELVSHYKFRDEQGNIEPQFELPDGTRSDTYAQGAKIIEGSKLDSMVRMAKQDVLLESLGANESALTDENLKQEVNDRLPFKLFEIDSLGKGLDLAVRLKQDGPVMAKDQFTNADHYIKFVNELRQEPKVCNNAIYEIARDKMVEKNRAFTQRLAQKIKSQDNPILFKVMDSVKDFDKRADDRSTNGKVSRKEIWKNIGKCALVGGGIAFATSFALSTGAAALAADASLTTATLGMNKFAGAILGTTLGIGAVALHVKQWRKSQKKQGKPAGLKAFFKNPQNLMSVATSALGGIATGALLTGNPAMAQLAGYGAIALGAVNGVSTNYVQIKKAGGNNFDAIAGGLAVGGATIGGGFLGRDASHLAIDMFNKWFPDNNVFQSQYETRTHVQDGRDEFVFHDREAVVEGSQQTLDHFYEGNEAQLQSDLADIKEFYKAHGIDFPEERALVMLADGGTNTNTDTINYTPHGNVHTYGNNLCMTHNWADTKGLDHAIVDALNVPRGPDGHLMMNMDAHNAIMKVNPFVSAHNAIGYVPNTDTYSSGVPFNASRDGAGIPIEDLNGGKEFGTYINHEGVGEWQHTPGTDIVTRHTVQYHGNIMATVGTFFKPLVKRTFKMGSALADKTISVFKKKPKDNTPPTDQTPPTDNTPPTQTPPTDNTPPTQTPPTNQTPPTDNTPPVIKEPPVQKTNPEKVDERLTPILEGLEKRKLLCEEFQMVYGYNPALQKVKDNDEKIKEKPTNPSKDSNFVEFEGIVEKERVAAGGKPMLEFLRERREKYVQVVGEGLKDKELAEFKENPATCRITKDIRQDYLHSSSAENNTWSFAKFTEHSKGFVQRLISKQQNSENKVRTTDGPAKNKDGGRE